MDIACSGKRECEYEVLNKELQATKPCPRGLALFAAYLEVDYQCIPGIKMIGHSVSLQRV